MIKLRKEDAPVFLLNEEAPVSGIPEGGKSKIKHSVIPVCSGTTHKSTKIDRNSICSCGSEKKYKKCCMLK